VNRHGHGAGGGGVGNFLSPDNMVAHVDQRPVRRPEMLVYGNDHLFGGRDKLNGLALGGMLPGGKAQPAPERTYSHVRLSLDKKNP
jgi:hypothetical protein